MSPSFKLNKFLISTMINYTLYLGYAHSQLNTKMAFYLLGSRAEISVHKLNLTYNALRNAISICNLIWYNYSMIWLVSPRNPYIGYLVDALNKKDKTCIKKSLLFWLSRWLPGFFNNTLGFVKLKKTLTYPAAIFYIQSTTNLDRIQESYLRGILNFNIVDTNSSLVGGYPINSNEITKLSNIYYSKLLLNSCFITKKVKKKNFII